MLEEDLQSLREAPWLDRVKLRRDRFHAHFDKEYFCDTRKLSSEAALSFPEMEHAMDLIHDIVNRYSSAYDGNEYARAPMNVTDVDRLLDALHDAKADKATQ